MGMTDSLTITCFPGFLDRFPIQHYHHNLLKTRNRRQFLIFLITFLKNNMFMKNSLFLVLSLFYYLLLCYLYSLSNDHLFYIKRYYFNTHFTSSDFFCLFFSVSTTEIINKDIGIVQTNQNESQTQISDQKQFFHSDKIIVFILFFYNM